ncbi:discoidin domain-containing protein [Jiangella sp. DSM 45060]|uniref:discoidin domain-containing protein n=1 Tax=Jiangella sp. DSM 45060 TaxID=1798224 RepID=UPI0012FD8D79|nr:discoidin domain-containing protein [Jiangella sp. DSM 45060]
MKAVAVAVAVVLVTTATAHGGAAPAASTTSVSGSSPVAGLLTDDTDPATGSVTSWGGTGGVAVDYLRRSVALDFSAPQRLRSVVLRDRDATSRAGADDYTLWYSDDNVTYQQLTGWHLDEAVVDGRLTHTFIGFDVTARYLKINTGFTDTAYTFSLLGLQADLVSAPFTAPDFGVMLHSDGDRLFPPGDLNCVENSTPCGVDALSARDTIQSEVDAIAAAGFGTLKIGLGTDVLNWDSQVGSGRDWRLDDPDWALPAGAWATYKDLRGRAHTARNLFQAGVDPVPVAAERARALGLKVFLSYRVADTHFTANPAGYPLTSEFYLTSEASADPADQVAISHSGASPVPGYPRFDRLMNLNRPRVRQDRLAVIEEALGRYDDVIDGFEADFSRSVALFPLNQGSANTAVVTQFLQDVRTAAGPLPLSIRVPGSQDVAVQQGLDVTELIRSRTVDVVVPTNVMTVAHDMDIRPWLAAAVPTGAGDQGVAVHAGLPARKPSGWSFPETYTDPGTYALSTSAENEQLLGATLGYRSMGAAGVELYNFAGLVASPAGRTRLAWLVAHLAAGASIDGLDRVFAVTPMYAKPYEGRFEHVKSLPAQFHQNGSAWSNSTDGAWAALPGNVHSSSIHVDGRADAATETWLLRIGIRAIAGQPLDLTALSLRITVNGTGVLWDGPVQVSPPAGLTAPAPAPTHYVTIPIAPGAPLADGVNDIEIRQNPTPAGLFGVAVQEIQIGVFA